MIKKQGITVTVLAITIIILTILAGTITVSTLSTINYSKLSSWANEIIYIQDVVDEAANRVGLTDYLLETVIINTDNMGEQDISQQFLDENISSDSTISLRIINLGKLNITNTIYGNLNSNTDVYAVSEKTGRVYYVEGVELDGKRYYSATDTIKSRFELVSDNRDLSSIVFIPSTLGYTNRPITVDVKMPNTYTDIVVTTSNNDINIGSQSIQDELYVYKVNENLVTGNYTITVTYNNGVETLTSKYEVKGYDATAPVIQELTAENFVYKETDGNIVDYLINITATDSSGIKVMKYAKINIEEKDAAEYFSKNGNVIVDGRINISGKLTTYTIYAEDNAGNFAILTFSNLRWVVAEVDGVPIPKGFVASPYDGEKTKNGGLVIYELKANETAIPSTETQYTSKTTRNQYVWVPVADFSKFVRKDYINTNSSVVNSNGTYNNLGSTGALFWETEVDENNIPKQETALSDYIADNKLDYISKSTLQEVQAMYASVKKYKGFYISRYEAGINTARTSAVDSEDNYTYEDKVYSVMGKIPYTYICKNEADAFNLDTRGAIGTARSVYPNNSSNNKGAISTLVYGVQWDTTLAWFVERGAMKLEEVNKTEGSAKYGNYSDHVIEEGDLNLGAKYAVYTTSVGEYEMVSYEGNKSTSTKGDGATWALSTGALEAANILNIYDMAGNVWEWTMEYYNNGTVRRGGDFAMTGIYNPLSNRNATDNIWADAYTGFRIALYIKNI